MPPTAQTPSAELHRIEGVMNELYKSASRGDSVVSIALRLGGLAAAITELRRAITPADEAIYQRMVEGRESFWTVVHKPFMSHDVTRETVRGVITKGLGETRGSYKLLLGLFNMDEADYKRFLNFLRKQECQVGFRSFRMMDGRNESAPSNLVVS